MSPVCWPDVYGVVHITHVKMLHNAVPCGEKGHPVTNGAITRPGLPSNCSSGCCTDLYAITRLAELRRQ